MILLICFREEVSSSINGTRISRSYIPTIQLHSNKQVLYTNDSVIENELNFAKQHLGTKPKETKTLGLLWDKREDCFIIQEPTVNKSATKRNILNTLAAIYDPLGFVSPCVLFV